MTRDRGFDGTSDEEDRNGADPLPEHIADISVTYADGAHHGKLEAAGGGAGIRVLDHV